MAQSDLDLLYTQFLSEASEEDGNFYFVKKFDEEMYDRMCKVESNAVINFDDSGSSLRNTLEYFLAKAYAAVNRGEGKALNTLFQYVEYFEKNPDLGIDANLAHVVRLTGNAFHHDAIELSKYTPDKTYRNLCYALKCMQELLAGYYKKWFPKEAAGIEIEPYDPDKQPYGDKMVCAVISAKESTSCEKQVLCSSQNKRLPDRTQYYLLRIYRAYDISEGAIRDEKVLGNLWGNTLFGLPNIVRYSPLRVEYAGEDAVREKKYIVSYDFGTFKPLPLHEKVIGKLSDKQKKVIMRDIAAGVSVLHRAGIYHRNLQPGCVFVFFDQRTDQVQAKLVGFEYAKIDGDVNTVIDYIQQRQGVESSPYFSMTMKNGLKNSQVGRRIDWPKEDIYSMGALFCLILTGKEPPVTLRRNSLSGIKDPGLKQLLSSMLSMDVQSRPDAESVLEVLQKYV